MTFVTLLITPLIPTHEPESRVSNFGGVGGLVRCGLQGLGFRAFGIRSMLTGSSEVMQEPEQETFGLYSGS